MTLVQFPADRRTADIRRCSEALTHLHGEEANRFWRQEMAGFAARLKAQGVQDMDISHQAALFMNAVQMELQAAFAEQEQAGACASLFRGRVAPLPMVRLAAYQWPRLSCTV